MIKIYLLCTYILFVFIFSSELYLLSFRCYLVEKYSGEIDFNQRKPSKDRAWIWYYFVCFNVLLKAILAKGCNKTIVLFLKSGMQVDIRITLLMFDTVDTPYKNTSGTEKYIPI